MKTCPVCNALAFDDASMCYGCLHTFDEDDCAHDNENSSPSGMPIASFDISAPAKSPSEGTQTDSPSQEAFVDVGNEFNSPIGPNGNASENAPAGQATFLLTLTPVGSHIENREWECSVAPL